MKILCIANCGFGDCSWLTSWPRIFTEQGHEVDVFLMHYTGNPYHENPYVKNYFEEKNTIAYKKIVPVIKEYAYDYVLLPNAVCNGVKEVIDATAGMKNVHLFKGAIVGQSVAGLYIPPLTKPELYFSDKELGFVENQSLCNSVLFHPVSSSVNEKSRNIDFSLIIECSKKIRDVVVIYGGRTYLPVQDLKKMEAAGVRLLWEGYNCFADKSGSVIGKFFALSSQCRASVHAWSGSFILPMGFNKPYVMVAPGQNIRANSGSPYIDTKQLYAQGMARANVYGCLNPSAWCVTEDANVITEAVNFVVDGQTKVYDKQWESYKY